jgi:hypothetical protein
MKKKAKKPKSKGNGWIARKQFTKEFIESKQKQIDPQNQRQQKCRGISSATSYQRFKTNDTNWKTQIEALKANKYC